MSRLFLKKTIGLAIALVFAFSITGKVSAQTKNTIDFRTSIVNAAGQPIADGNYNFRFALYNVANGGTALWSEDWFGVSARRAGISVQLGSNVAFPKNLFKNTSLYLQICLDANLAAGDGSAECVGSYEENFKPRKVVAGVPWAFNAQSLGPVTSTEGETAYNIDTYGDPTNLLNLNLNDNQRFTVDANGNLNFGNGLNRFTLSPTDNLFRLTEGSDIYFGENISLRNSSSNATSGASLIGVNTSGLANITGTNLQSVINNIDPLLKWKANGTSVFYNEGNVGIGLNTPSYPIDVVGTGNFTGGVILGDNTNLVEGAVRYSLGTFEGYNGTTWIPFAGAALSPWITNGSSIYYTTGNVGIGVTNPARALEVNGALRLDTIAQPGTPASGDVYSSGTALFYYNGTGWVNMTNDATTDNGAGLTYVTNVANSFGIGGSTAGTSEFVFDQTTGALYRRTQTIRNDPVAPSSSLLTLDASGGNARVGGSFNGQTGTLAYTPSGGNGSQIVNSNDTTLTINGGDGTAMDRIRGALSTLTNNSNGSANSVLNFSTTTTNNGAFTNMGAINNQLTNNAAGAQVIGTNNNLVNNGNLSSTLRGSNNVATNNGTVTLNVSGSSSFAVNAVGASSNQIDGQYAQSNNNGTTAYQFGTRNVTDNTGNITTYGAGSHTGFYNTGTIQQLYGTYTEVTNAVGGTINNDIIGLSVNSNNLGTTTGNVYGIYNILSNSGTVSGDTIGLLSSDGVSSVLLNDSGTYALRTTGQGVKFSNQAIVGNSTGTNEAGAIRWSGTDFEGFNGSSWVSFTSGGGGPLSTH